MVKDPQVFLKHIRDYCDKVITHTQDILFVDFKSDEILQLAIIKILEMIGEACNNLTDAFQDSHREIPWAQIISFRNKTSHEYWDIDIDHSLAYCHTRYSRFA